MKKVVLIVMDGWGIATKKAASAIDKASTPVYNSLINNYANSTLEASGRSVGLPDGQMGNSEVGHMNIGAGRIVYQDLVKINLATEDGSLAQNDTIKRTMEYLKSTGKKLHLIGLVSDGGVHAHVYHLKGLLSIAHQYGLSKVFVHAFTDGRDTDPKSGYGFVEEVINHMKTTTGKVASVVGRYYAMDRDKRWERVKKAYDLMVNGVGETTDNVLKAIQKSYDEGVTDEFLLPIVSTENGKPVATIEEDDVVICFNFRTDRGREITEALTQKAFPEHEMKPLNLKYITMTRYDHTFKQVDVVFEKDDLNNTLGEVLANAGKKQIRIAETEKYPHVTFFFSGGRENPFIEEKRIMVPSPKVATYDLQPEMSAFEVTEKIVAELEAEWPDFVCLNFANPDMVGHTGVFEAAVKAVETVDSCVGKVVEVGKKHGYAFIIIADHGNADVMVNEDGSPNTAHSTNLVPCILVNDDYKKGSGKGLKNGILGDLAPTILDLMGLKAPVEMTGKSLIR